MIDVPVRIQAEAELLHKRSSEVIFNLIATDADDLYVTEEARFIGPIPMK